MEECLINKWRSLGILDSAISSPERKENKPPTCGSEGSPLNGSTGTSLRWQAVTTRHRLSTCPKPLVKMEFQISPENISHLKNTP